MKTPTLRAWSLTCALALAGCVSGTAGGPGTTAEAGQPLLGEANDTFRLSAPETAIRQGEARSFSITIDRAMNFDEDVTIAFGDLPQGLSIDDRSPVILHGGSEARLVLAAATDASLGEFSVKVTGHPVTGTDSVNHLRIVVTKG
jgi:hypothetical protein